MLDMDALITGAQAARAAGVTRANICYWRNAGHLKVKGHHKRSPLYRFGDVLAVDRETRQSKHSPRKICRDAA